MNQKLLFYAAAVGVAFLLIGLTRMTGGDGQPGLLAAAGAYDQYGYNRIAREFKGTGENWCRANDFEKDCLAEYSYSTYFIKWNQEWDRGVRDAWVRTPYNAEVTVQSDGQSYAVRWIGICSEGEALPTGGTCVWGEYTASAESGQDVYVGPFGAWLQHALPEKL